MLFDSAEQPEHHDTPNAWRELMRREDREALPTAIERSLTGVERVTSIVRAMKSFAHPDGDRMRVAAQSDGPRGVTPHSVK